MIIAFLLMSVDDNKPAKRNNIHSAEANILS